MMDALKNSGLSDTDQKKLKTLLGMSATQRVNSVMDAAGNVYTEAGKDADGNTIYAYDNNGTKQYIQKVVTYQEAIILPIQRMMTELIQIKMVMSGQQPVIRMMMEMQNILISQMMARHRRSVSKKMWHIIMLQVHRIRLGISIQIKTELCIHRMITEHMQEQMEKIIY